AIFAQLALHALGVVSADDDAKADAAVEDAIHLGLLDVAELLEPCKHRRHGPTAAFQNNAPTSRQDARQIIDQATPRDLRQPANDAALYRVVPEKGLDGSDIDSGRLEQFLPDSPAQVRNEIGHLELGMIEDHLADQTVAIGVQPT